MAEYPKPCEVLDGDRWLPGYVHQWRRRRGGWEALVEWRVDVAADELVFPPSRAKAVARGLSSIRSERRQWKLETEVRPRPQG